MKSHLSCVLVAVLSACTFTTRCNADETLKVQVQELPVQLQVGYAVRAIDINADGRLDIAIVDSKRVLWLENPTWATHVIYETPDAKFDNVCFAPHDINGDGRVDLALGADWQPNNSDSGGSIGWLEHTASGPWKYREIASEPTTHRMNWIDIAGAGKPQLIVAPLKGRGSRAPGFEQTPLRLLAFEPASKPTEETWGRSVVTDQLHVMHNFEVTDLDEDGKSDLITASYEGVNWLRFADSGASASKATIRHIGAGQVETPPKRGSSEIRRGKLADGRNFIATIEPWHGDKVVVYVAPDNWQKQTELWPRFILDEELAWGHAVAIANLDDDADQELVIGVRDNQSDAHRCGARVYDPVDAVHGKWNRQIIDAGGVAVEDLVTADLDKDGDQDIIAVGRATHNAKIYWNQ
ncbi:MAG: VCBS repeat-containing protein [Pirellulaceae bacterium]|nr:VCBS repeat-containing protein [Pirellulaceae bacterium]